MKESFKFRNLPIEVVMNQDGVHCTVSGMGHSVGSIIVSIYYFCNYFSNEKLMMSARSEAYRIIKERHSETR